MKDQDSIEEDKRLIKDNGSEEKLEESKARKGVAGVIKIVAVQGISCALSAVGVPNFVSGVSGEAAGFLAEQTVKHVGNKKTK